MRHDEQPATWNIAAAKANFSKMLARAQHTPQMIVRHGKPDAVVVSVAEWERKTARKGSLVEFLRNSPLVEANLELERLQDEPASCSCWIPISCQKPPNHDRTPRYWPGWNPQTKTGYF